MYIQIKFYFPLLTAVDVSRRTIVSSMFATIVFYVYLNYVKNVEKFRHIQLHEWFVSIEDKLIFPIKCL